MVMAWLISLPLMAALLLLPVRRHARFLAAPIVVGTPLIGLGLLLSVRGEVFEGRAIAWRQPWLEDIGLSLSLRLDGLAYVFALLVLGIGLLVILYARYYLPRSESTVRFFSLLLLFMAAMLGVVLSSNLLLLAVFWEMT